MGIGIGIVVGSLGLSAVVDQVFFANADNFLTVSQMKKRGFEKGLPLIAHAGIWGDLVILTPLLAIITGLYGNLWDARSICEFSVISLALTSGMGLMWVKGAESGLPEAHTHGGRMTTAGFVHAIYMAVAIVIILLFFFRSNITKEAAIVVSIILGIHVIYGTHIVLGLIAPEWFPNRPHRDPVTWVVVLSCWSALFWRCITI